MPSLKTDCVRQKPWKARVKFQYEEYFLGYFASEEEAKDAEAQARIALRGTPLATRTWGRL